MPNLTCFVFATAKIICNFSFFFFLVLLDVFPSTPLICHMLCLLLAKICGAVESDPPQNKLRCKALAALSSWAVQPLGEAMLCWRWTWSSPRWTHNSPVLPNSTAHRKKCKFSKYSAELYFFFFCIYPLPPKKTFFFLSFSPVQVKEQKEQQDERLFEPVEDIGLQGTGVESIPPTNTQTPSHSPFLVIRLTAILLCPAVPESLYEGELPFYWDEVCLGLLLAPV